MSDPRVTKLAQVLVKYALDLQPGQEFCLMTAPLAKELALAVYKEALLAGAHVHVQMDLPGATAIHSTRTASLPYEAGWLTHPG